MNFEVEEDVNDPGGDVERILIGLGSNLGDRKAQLAKALSWLREARGLRVVGTSSVYETRPEGGPPQGDYLNACVLCETNLEPRDVLDQLLTAESLLGRVRNVPDGPRCIDLDLLLFGERQIEEPDLVIPHPRFHLRPFALIPAAEVAPDFRHPALRRTVGDLAAALGNPPGIARRRRTGIWERWQ